MSNAPGPEARSSSTVKGQRSMVPAGHTVSRWPSSSTRDVGPNRQSSRGRPSMSARSAFVRRRFAPREAITSAQWATRLRSAEGDSASTTARRSSTIAGIRERSSAKRSMADINAHRLRGYPGEVSIYPGMSWCSLTRRKARTGAVLATCSAALICRDSSTQTPGCA